MREGGFLSGVVRFPVESATGLMIEMGAFDGLTGLRLSGHIVTAEKGDDCNIANGLPTAHGVREAFP